MANPHIPGYDQASRVIEFPQGIKVNISPDNLAAGTVQISQDLYETCPSCGQRTCIYQCDGSHLGQVETEDTVGSRLAGNAMIDTTAAVILAHACAGVNVDSAEYRAGIQTMFDAIENSS